MAKIEDGFFKTTDILLASVLNQEYGLDRLERYNHEGYAEARFIFVFILTKQLEQKVADWNKLNLLVEPRRFYNGVKALKSLCAIQAQAKAE